VTRDAAAIWAGLVPARPARAIRSGERIHVVGIAGAGASAAALHAASQGAIVSGCDIGGPSPYTPALEAAAIPLAWAHDPGHVSGGEPPDRLAVTTALTAVNPDHPELAAARRASIPLEAWQQVVADAAFGKRLVAVAGTHGKSTTAGWLTHLLVAAGRDPSAFVGALLPSSITGGLAATARRGGGAVFVVEADEYAGNFDPYRPDVVAITNIDWDHPDVFADRDAVVSAFAAWLARVPAATIIANIGDPGVVQLLDRLGGRPGATVAVRAGEPNGSSPAALGAEAIVAGRDETQVAFRGTLAGHPDPVSLRLPGEHNVANAVVVAAAARELGLSWDEVTAGLESFEGVGRRLERKGTAGGVVIYDDYGHHPTAIRATIEAIRQREPQGRIWVAAEPLTFHRTAAMLGELAAALAQADGIAVADIWPGRDRVQDRAAVSSALVAEAVRRAAPGKLVGAPGDVEATAGWLAERVVPGDVVLVTGGGNSYRVADRLLDHLRARPVSAAGG
jgi:UDP-N-acetylmuramate--alanine ligase